MPNTREKLIELQKAAIREFMSSTTDVPLTDFIADHLIANGVTVQEWISVKERLPERYQNVLTARTDGKIRFDAIGSLDVWYEEVNYVGCPVTHWMPLPQPPKGE